MIVCVRARSVRVHLRACARASERVRACVCVCACVRARVRACVCVLYYVRQEFSSVTDAMSHLFILANADFSLYQCV